MPEKQDPAEKLTEASAAYARQVERTRGQHQYRDEVILEAWKAGISWPQIMATTGLSRRGVHLALERARQA